MASGKRHDPGEPERIRSPFRDLRFMLFTVADGVLSLHDSVLVVLLPLWVATQTAAPISIVSVLLAVNTVLTVLLQVYVTRFAESPARALRLVSAAVWNLSYELAPEPARARYLGAFSLGATSQRVIGPVLMTAVVLPLGRTGWLLLAVLFALAAPVVRMAGRPRTRRAAGLNS
jgi:hypothetical protein